ncbi:transcriptional regulator [Photorhabdus sp. S12-55]|uniref:cell morphology transcriptional regulator XreR1 n=1 Tax=Photorhabdus TaxID=29487 RepID=UPI000DCD8166|nr:MULTISPECIES: cell morphology transcriptional regulator XreR1 [Photorhabdus]AXG44532.1 transcriptional regulator [Photorhabdus laumondii subsp. laumondii]NDL16435.1 helix-turn-helix domain-containing protein [Photorhabdus laumondii subsp. laumondii]NDL48787.1 helix-turn-helix domain-containing protein [Photorhabdus laumondii subsp. laumondii]NDL51044.1 helix-turn-helix domain-containing protein [Photorhabdus laumondii subsp. laumondii]RAW84401.1 transcriptional regulator [Photorhabdus sp. S
MKKPKAVKFLFGQRVRYFRQSSGMSQEAFADKCGIDRTYISGIERGVRNPTLEIINIIASGLQIELTDLFDFSAKPKG